MANITLLGASYTDVPAVTLPQTGGGTVTFYEGGGGGGVDIPTFTITIDTTTGSVSEVTCDKSYADCLSCISDGKTYGQWIGTQGASSISGTAVLYRQYNDYIIYTALNGIVPTVDIYYYPNGTFYVSETSAQYTELNITANGITYPTGYTSKVNVNVPQPTGSITITENGTHDVASYASAVVNVSGGGGASNFVHGEFHTNSAYGQQVITIPYTGTGYAIMATVVVKGGAYVSGTTWYDAISRYAVGVWSMTKSNMSVAPASHASAVVQSIYKNSTSSATTYTRNSSMSQGTFATNSAASANGCVVFRNPTTMSVYVQNTSYGLLKDLDYEYFIVYSS